MQADARATQKAQEKTEATATPVVQQRKDQKRLEADLRNLLRPLKQKIEKLEQQQAKLTSRVAEIEQALGDSAIYDASRKAELTKLLAEQTSQQQQLNQVEEEWFELQEQLEQQTNDFWTKNA